MPMHVYSDPENVNDLVKKVEEIEDLIKNVVSLTERAKVITQCSRLAYAQLMLFRMSRVVLLQYP